MAKDMAQALDSLMRKQRDGLDNTDNGLPAPKPRGEFPSKTSAAVPDKAPGGGDGIASPLTEVSREYHAGEATSASSDGIFRFRLQAIKQIQFDDAQQRRVVFDFSNVSS